MKLAAKIVDKRRKMEKIQKSITNPMSAIEVNKEDKLKRNKTNTSDVISIVKQMEEDLEEGTIRSVETDGEGTITVKDASKRIIKPKIEDESYRNKIEELNRKSSEVQEQLNRKLEEERENLEATQSENVSSDNNKEEK